MRFVVAIFLCQLFLYSSSQVPDTTRQGKFKKLTLSKYPKKEVPLKKNAYVIVTSEQKISDKSDPWENAWTAYIEEQSQIIAGKVLAKDSARKIYKVLIDFWVNEDGSLKELRVSCVPSNNLIVQECTKMAVNGPKRKSMYNEGKYVRMHVSQPVDIKVLGDQ